MIEATVESVIAEARSWLRTPWHHRARVKGLRGGVDCVMLLAEVYEAVGAIEHVEPEYYPADIMLHRGGEPVVVWLERLGVEVSAPVLGGVIVYQFGHSYSHAGICVGTDAIIHAYRSCGQVVETRFNDSNLDGRPRRYFAMKGVL
ncbi:hypothetical protein [Paraburkholderia sp.]|uniref:hypothetical protein n=1 Tax=Paraburkholderia sp. TaxID=1926495 RepID=UPI003C7994C9